jgi:phospholipase/carboxylesterase
MMMLDGPRLAPAGTKPNALVVLLHGYGSNGADLISLAPYWAKALPGAAFVAPNAPEPVPGAPGGYQWFDLAMRDPRLLEMGARRAAGSIDRFLDRELERHGLDDSRMALVGFSQGTMMALHVGLRRPKPPAAIVGFSGALVGGKLKEEARAKPPILLIHGDRDERIPLEAMFHAAVALAEAELSAQWHISYGVPHAIGPDGLELGGRFLKAMLAGRPVGALAQLGA